MLGGWGSGAKGVGQRGGARSLCVGWVGLGGGGKGRIGTRHSRPLVRKRTSVHPTAPPTPKPRRAGATGPARGPGARARRARARSPARTPRRATRGRASSLWCTTCRTNGCPCSRPWPCPSRCSQGRCTFELRSRAARCGRVCCPPPGPPAPWPGAALTPAAVWPASWTAAPPSLRVGSERVASEAGGVPQCVRAK